MELNPIPLGIKQIQKQLEKLTSWEIEAGKLEKTFNFPDFKTARDFVNKLALLAEQEEHHPEILWQYNTVKIMLFTHKISSLSNLDFSLAEKTDKISICN
ncbi:MAG: 4a-hydroxytetrahydrobiopterin dehydratase [Nanoarchaeota archaeon]|nr:4a-hydroxytetrahydrobiopterin dehydratase [Nanoarchaeota archaeon]